MKKKQLITAIAISSAFSFGAVADEYQTEWQQEFKQYTSQAGQTKFAMPNGNTIDLGITSHADADDSHLGILTTESGKFDIFWLVNRHGKKCGFEANEIISNRVVVNWGISYRDGHDSVTCKSPFDWRLSLLHNKILWFIDGFLSALVRNPQADERESRKPTMSKKWSEPVKAVEVVEPSHGADDDPSHGADDDPNMGGFFAEHVTKVSDSSRHKLPSWCGSSNKNSSEKKLCKMMEGDNFLAGLDILANKLAGKIKSSSRNNKRTINSIIRSFCKKRDLAIKKGASVEKNKRMYGEHIAGFARRGLITKDELLEGATEKQVVFLTEG